MLTREQLILALVAAVAIGWIFVLKRDDDDRDDEPIVGPGPGLGPAWHAPRRTHVAACDDGPMVGPGGINPAAYR